MSIGASTHAVERYQIHEPSASRSDVIQAWVHGEEISEDMARPLMGRPTTRSSRHDGFPSTYRLVPSRRGILVGAADDRSPNGITIITYVRFGQDQEDFAKKHWPLLSETGIALWMSESLTKPDNPGDNDSLHGLYPYYVTWASRTQKPESYSSWLAAIRTRYASHTNTYGVEVFSAKRVSRAAYDLPDYPMLFSRDTILNFVHPMTGTKLSEIRITNCLAQECGGEMTARRYLYFGGAVADPDTKTGCWLIRHKDGTHITVPLCREAGNWRAGQRDDVVPVPMKPVPPVKMPHVHGMKNHFIQVYQQPVSLYWGIREFLPPDPLKPHSRGIKDHKAGIPTQTMALEQAAAYGLPVYLQTDCTHCGEAVSNKYQVHDTVWAESGTHSFAGELHLWCLEDRLHRNMTLEDITDDSVNDSILFGFRMAREGAIVP